MSVFIFTIMGLFLIRAAYVNRIVRETIDKVCRYNILVLYAGRYDERLPYPCEDGVEPVLMTLQLHKWSMESFFPEIYKKMAEAGIT